MHAQQILVFQNTLSNMLTLGKNLGNPVTIGVALLKQHLDEEWATVQEIARVVNVSEDTVRRRLTELTEINRVECQVEGQRKLYRLRPAFADALLQKMKWDHTILDEVPAAPQVATADCD